MPGTHSERALTSVLTGRKNMRNRWLAQCSHQVDMQGPLSRNSTARLYPYYTIEEMDASFTGIYLLFRDRDGRNQVWRKVTYAAVPQPWNGGHSYQFATSFRDLHAVPTQGLLTPIAAPVITHGASPTQAGPSVIGFRCMPSMYTPCTWVKFRQKTWKLQ